MPNHVTTVITAPAEVLDSLSAGDPTALVDFNTLIPFPDALKNITAEVKVFDTKEGAESCQEMTKAKFAGWPASMQEPDAVHALTKDVAGKLLAEYGALHWYDWKPNNWGTKWNAYDAERTAPDTIKFDTAWAHPGPVILALAAKFPDTEIVVKYADEDLGHNYGEYTITDAEVVQRYFQPGEGLDFAAQIKYGMPYAALQATWGDEDEVRSIEA